MISNKGDIKQNNIAQNKGRCIVFMAPMEREGEGDKENKIEL